MSNPESILYKVPSYTVYQAAESAIADLGLTVQSADPNSLLIHFCSPRRWRAMAGEELSMLIIEESQSAAFAQVSAKVNGHLEVPQIPEWEIGRVIARMVHDRIRQYINESTPKKLAIPASKVACCRVCRFPIESGKEFCKSCGQARGGTGGAAKKKQPQKQLEESDDDFFAALGIDTTKKKPAGARSIPASKPLGRMPSLTATPTATKTANGKSAAASRPATVKPSGTNQANKKVFQQQQLILPCDCGARLRLKSRTKGLKVRCPKCEQVLVLD